jgi:hypothetical protein
VQVGCTINYGRRGLWKEIEEWFFTTKSRRKQEILPAPVPLPLRGQVVFAVRVDYPRNVGENDSALPSIRGAGVRRFNCGPVAQLGARFHGMEEVVGSIPTRSTKSLYNLDRAHGRIDGVCVMVCVITRRFGAQSKGFHRCSLRFHPHVAVPLQHATAHVSGNCHDR